MPTLPHIMNLSKDTDVINYQTFLDFSFHSNIPVEEFEVHHHSNLKRWGEYKKSILLGICECLSGAQGQGLAPLHLDMRVEIPPDTNQFGLVEVRFQGQNIFVMSMMTTLQPVMQFHLVSSQEE